MFFHSLFAIYCTQGLLREIKAEFWPSGNTVKRNQRFDVVLGIYYRKKCGHVEQTQNKSVPVPLHSPVLSSADLTSHCQRLYLEENSNTMCWIFGWQSFIDNRYEQKALQRPGRINCVMCMKEENKVRSKETNGKEYWAIYICWELTSEERWWMRHSWSWLRQSDKEEAKRKETAKVKQEIQQNQDVNQTDGEGS